MIIEPMIALARRQGASDLHIEPGLPATIRVQGELAPVGKPMDPATTATLAREIIGEAHWEDFENRRSADLSRTLAGVRCRLNVLHSSRGVGVAVRLLAGVQPTLERLNLHPDLKNLISSPHGLVLVCGPTGSGKSSTMAALIHEINLSESSHILTIEEPIEYFFRPRRSFIRQREVGRDTPSFEQGLIDALREDPDVVMVGEMRVPDVMRLTLNIAETGHLTFATVHSSNCGEALQRVVSAFPAEIQAGVQAQLADCLIGVVCQRLQYWPKWKLRLPELEILTATSAVRNHVRQGHFYKLASAISTGAQDGMWTFERYRQWMEARPRWYVPPEGTRETPDSETDILAAEEAREMAPERLPAAPVTPAAPADASDAPAASAAPPTDVFDISASEEDLSSILSELRKRG
jgi:twitching motility protein PilT